MTRDNLSAADGRTAEFHLEVLEVEVATLADTIREQKALPLTDQEADLLARSLEVAGDEDELLASTIAVLRLVVDRLEPSPPNGDQEPGRF